MKTNIKKVTKTVFTTKLNQIKNIPLCFYHTKEFQTKRKRFSEIVNLKI